MGSAFKLLSNQLPIGLATMTNKCKYQVWEQFKATYTISIVAFHMLETQIVLNMCY